VCWNTVCVMLQANHARTQGHHWAGTWWPMGGVSVTAVRSPTTVTSQAIPLLGLRPPSHVKAPRGVTLAPLQDVLVCRLDRQDSSLKQKLLSVFVTTKSWIKFFLLFHSFAEFFLRIIVEQSTNVLNVINLMTNIPFPPCMFDADTERPVINGCPTTPIIVPKYDQLSNYLPTLNPSDNTGIKTITWNPSNANTNYIVTGPLTVTYTVTDFSSNTATNSASCTMTIAIRG